MINFEKLFTEMALDYEALIMTANIDVDCDLLKKSLEKNPLPIVYRLK